MTRHALLAILCASACFSSPRSSLALPAPDDSAGAPNPDLDGRPAGARVEFRFSQFPPDGLIIGTLQGCIGCDPSLSLTFQHPDRSPIEGTFVELPALDDETSFAFRPAMPLEPGNYLVESNTQYSLPSYFTVQAPSADEPTFETDLSYITRGTGTEYQCELQAPSTRTTSFFSHTLTEGRLTLGFSHPSFSQLQLQVALNGGEPEPIPYSQHIVDLGSDPEVDCIVVTGTPYDGGDAVEFAEECFDSFAMGPTGISTDLYGDIDLTLETCLKPPTEWEAEWCELFSSAITEESCAGFNEASCLAARRTCPGGDLPYMDPESPEFPYDESMQASRESGSSSSSGAATDANGDTEPQVRGGCSVARSERGGTPFWGAALGLLSLGLLWGRRRNRC